MAVCVWCGGPVGAWKLAKLFDECRACWTRLEETFLHGFGLHEDVHFTRGTDGGVDAWVGEPTMAAAAMWRHLHEMARKDGTLAGMTEADFVRWTQSCLARLHGTLPAPFAVPAGAASAGEDAKGAAVGMGEKEPRTPKNQRVLSWLHAKIQGASKLLLH